MQKDNLVKPGENMWTKWDILQRNRNHCGVLELKNVMNEMETAIESICIRVEEMGELEDRYFEITQLRIKEY